MKSEEANKQNQNAQTNYQQENKLLRQIYEQRMKAKKQQINQSVIQQQQIVVKPMLKNSKQMLNTSKLQQKQQQIGLLTEKIFMNSLYYDLREKKPKNFIKFTSLFNQQVGKPRKYVSENIQSVFITTYGFDIQTFQRMLKESQLKLVILNDSDQVGQNKIIKQYAGFKNLTVILKAKNYSQKYGVFHSKLWFIKFKTFLRVVICTSNQHTMDWTTWQNAFWYQDFPAKDITLKVDKTNVQQIQNQHDLSKDFYQTLLDVVAAMLPLKQLEELTKIKLDSYIFNNIKVALIPSIPGRHYGEKMKKQGMCKIQQIMKKYNQIINPVLTYQSTSLGIVDRKIIEDIYKSFCPRQINFKIENYKLIYPTKKYIQQETGGQASILFLTSDNFNKSDVGKKIFYKFDTNPQNPILGCIPHLKMILIQSPQNNQSLNQKGFVYLGSHNMTRAAWGKLEKQGSQLYIANAQLGLLFFDVDMKSVKSWAPFKYPPQPYSDKDSPFFRDFLH